MALMDRNEPVRRALPAELLSEIFGCLPLANSYGLLAQMPNAILARNVRGVLSRTQMPIFDNKWANCGPDLAISADELETTRNGQRPNRDNNSPIYVPPFLMFDEKPPNSVRAQMPVRIFKGGIMPKKAYITGYYEVQILVKNRTTIPTGFSDQKFPLDGNFIGKENNSMGTWHKQGIHVDGQYFRAKQGNNDRIQVGDVMGCGIAHFPLDNRLKFFFTCNGQLLGSVVLPPKYLHIPLFATATMWTPGNAIRANFGKQKFSANLTEILAELI